MQNTYISNDARRGVLGSAGGQPRIKSSLMGTSARQKLLKYKLARQAADSVAMTGEQKSEIAEQIASLKKAESSASKPENEFDHFNSVKVDLKPTQAKQREQKIIDKKRLLEQAYKKTAKSGAFSARSNSFIAGNTR